MKKRLQTLSHNLVLFFCIAITILTPILYLNPVHAAEDSIWVGKGEPSLHIESNYEEGDMRGTYASQKCQISRARVINQNSSIVENHPLCLINTPHGRFDQYGYIYIPSNSSTGLDVARYNEQIIAITPSKVIRAKGYTILNFYENPEKHLADSHRQNPTSPDHTLSDDNGNPISLSILYMGFSSNGEWMFAKTNANRLIRVNLETYEITAIAENSGISPFNGFFAISNDGRYGYYYENAHVPGAPLRNLIIDFSTCSQSGYSNVNTDCKSLDLSNSMRNAGGNLSRIGYPYFNTDATQLNVEMPISGKMKNVSIVAPNNQYSGLDYLALGDSFASGEGDTQGHIYYKEGTDVRPSTQLPKGEKCHISRRSYPYLIAQHMQISSENFKSIACSGAITDDVKLNGKSPETYLGQDDRLANIGSEITTYRENARKTFIPGRIAQLEFVDKYKPKAVTISIGGNDAHFADVIKACVVPAPLPGSTCDYAADDAATRHRKATEVHNLANRLREVYEAINKVSPQTKIYVLGYSKIVNSQSACSYFNFDYSERVFLNEAFIYMNDIVEAASKNAGVKYIDVEDALGDAVICGNGSPRATNGVKFGDDIGPGNIKIIGNESFHPNEHGHAKIAQSIIRQTQPDLKQHEYCDMPEIFVCSEDSPIPQLPTYFVHDKPIENKPLDQDIVTEGLPYRLNQQIPIKQEHRFKPNSSVTITLRSEPVTLANVSADTYGSINTTITIPSDIPVGYHTLHLIGENISGEKVDYYQPILILGHDGDVDNNDTPDHTQSCIEAPVAVTTQNGDIYPCHMEIDTSPSEEPPQEPEENNPGQGVTDFIEDLWRRIKESPIFQRLPGKQQEHLASLYNNEIAPSLKKTLIKCHDEQPSRFHLGIFTLTVSCKSHGNQLVVSVQLSALGFPIFITKSTI